MAEFTFEEFDSEVPDVEPEQNVKPIQTTSGTDFTFDEFDEPTDEEKAYQNLSMQSEKDPVTASNVLSIADETGFAPELVERNVNTLQKKREAYKVDLSKHPITARHYANPQNSLMTKDDIENFKAMEDAMRSYNSPDLSTSEKSPTAFDYLTAFPSGALQGLGMGFSGIGEALEAGTRMTTRGLDVILPESADKYLYKSEATPETFQKINETLSYITPSTFFEWEGAGLERMAEDIAPEQSNLGTQVMSGLGQLTGQALMTIANPQSATVMMGGMGVEMQAQKQRETSNRKKKSCYARTRATCDALAPSQSKTKKS